MRANFFGHVFGIFFLTIGLTTLGVTYYAASVVDESAHNQAEEALRSPARWAALYIDTSGTLEDRERLQSLCDDLFAGMPMRLTVIAADGTVLADTDADSIILDNHRFRPEVVTAMAGTIGSSHRYSETLQEFRSYVAVPVERAGKVQYIVRSSVFAPRGASEAFGWIALVTVVASLLGAFAAYRALGPIVASLQSIREGAEILSSGDQNHKLAMPESHHFTHVVNAINRMASEVERRVATAEERRNALEAVLSSMVEGVLSFDTDGRILNLNRAAADFFEVNPSRMVGVAIEEAIRISELHEFARTTLESDTVIEGEIIVYDEGTHYLQAHGTTLLDASGRSLGGVIVVNDITRIRQLEEARREFVANVSHELRTPITAIKGYTETLLDGALDDPDTTLKFLRTVSRQSDRLNQLIEDLLTLSSIERNEEVNRIERENAPLSLAVDGALVACAIHAQERNITLECDVDGGISMWANVALLQQLISNLVENAIKYSDEGSTVRIWAAVDDPLVRIAVEDEGCGIAAEHIPRLFERFYRVDRARSRAQGGTGLGLAIVKHIALAHGGTVDVTSKVGKGTTFYISLPMAPKR